MDRAACATGALHRGASTRPGGASQPCPGLSRGPRLVGRRAGRSRTPYMNPKGPDDPARSSGQEPSFRESHHNAERLVCAVQDLWRAPDLQTLLTIAARAARELTGADGASLVLRDGELCHCAREDAISSLWQGRRFPMSSCVSGWVMQNRTPAVVDDIALDPRIPLDVYRPTFVRSMARGARRHDRGEGQRGPGELLPRPAPGVLRRRRAIAARAAERGRALRSIERGAYPRATAPARALDVRASGRAAQGPPG
ncbi:GAF domain-containing protein [Sorangium sp. So ce887]|uniref:GAF domain-containing protein n=1 Tax=Sorangium sp. So ce887 TaxID=3133324 RepID=UPI003F5E8431